MNFRAYAKINVGLRILEKRPDGYHNIETIFHQIDFFDDLAVDPARSMKLTTTSHDVPVDSTNLCLRAAQLMKDRTGFTDGVDIHLTKRIPVGAGLGGGSSDAAAILVALNKLWHIGMSKGELESLGAHLGSDVPFFVQGGSAVGTSRGEVLEHTVFNIPYWILTVTPPVHVSTAWAYSHVHVDKHNSAKPLQMLVKEGLGDAVKPGLNITNDFEELVFRTYPEIQRLKGTLDAAGAVFSQLSGSGASVYGFFRDKGSARMAAELCSPTCSTSLTAPDFKPEPIP